MDAWDGLWPMKWSGRAEVDHTWRGTPSGHQSYLERLGEESRQLKSVHKNKNRSQNCQEQDDIVLVSVTTKCKDSKVNI